MKVVKNVLEAIGNTPLVQLQNVVIEAAYSLVLPSQGQGLGISSIWMPELSRFSL